jgi:hypothetical protein
MTGDVQKNALANCYLYRDPGGSYYASNNISRRDDWRVSVQDGEAFLKGLGMSLDEVGFGYVVVPKRDLAQSAYDRLCKVDAIEDEAERADELAAINMTIATRLGYRVQVPTNYPYVTITTDRFASPYARDNWLTRKFEELPEYDADLVAAMSVASSDWDLNLEQAGEVWTAVYKHRGSGEAYGHKGDLVRTVLLSALLTRIEPR